MRTGGFTRKSDGIFARFSASSQALAARVWNSRRESSPNSARRPRRRPRAPARARTPERRHGLAQTAAPTRRLNNGARKGDRHVAPLKILVRRRSTRGRRGRHFPVLNPKEMKRTIGGGRKLLRPIIAPRLDNTAASGK